MLTKNCSCIHCKELEKVDAVTCSLADPRIITLYDGGRPERNIALFNRGNVNLGKSISGNRRKIEIKQWKHCASLSVLLDTWRDYFVDIRICQSHSTIITLPVTRRKSWYRGIGVIWHGRYAHQFTGRKIITVGERASNLCEIYIRNIMVEVPMFV